MAVIGEDIPKSIITQINARQNLHGSGVKVRRTIDQIKLLNSSNAFLKIASGVTLTEDKAQELGFQRSQNGTIIPKNYILANGVSSLKNDKLFSRSNFIDGTYEKSDFGLIPMAGLKQFNVKNLNRGSLKKATISFNVHSKEQFSIVDTLYLRLGYTVLIEWGHSHFLGKDSDETDIVKTMGNTLIEDPEGFFSPTATYSDLQAQIQNLRESVTMGNYDGLLGKISNFEWVYNPDGTYDITLTIISIGDVIESLKVNLPITDEISQFQALAAADRSGPPFEGSNKSMLHAMFWIIRYLNRKRWDGIESIETWNGSGYYIGKLCKLNGKDEPANNQYRQKWKFYGYYDVDGTSCNGANHHYARITREITISDDTLRSTGKSRKSYMKTWRKNKKWECIVKAGEWSGCDTVADWKEWADKKYNTVTQTKVFAEVIPYGAFTPEIDPQNFFSKGDLWKTCHESNPAFYIRFGALLKYIQDEILPVYVSTNEDSSQSSTPIVNIAYDELDSFFYMMPNQRSLDVGKCWLQTAFKFDLPQKAIDAIEIQEGDEGTKITKGATRFAGKKGQLSFVSSLSYEPTKIKEDTASTSKGTIQSNTIFEGHINKGLTMNIYLNFSMVIDALNKNTNADNDISLYSFIEDICKELNVSMGGVNNLEPVLDEESNTLKIIDTTPIPGEVPVKPDTPYKLRLFGYNKTQNESNFVRNLNIKTTITPEYATMITVGSTSAGYTKGVEATAFSKWNRGIVDRFKEKVENSSQNVRESEEKGFPNVVQVYLNKYLGKISGAVYCSDDVKPFNTSNKFWVDGISADKSSENVSVVSEFYKYALSRFSLLKSGGTTSAVGFIPFKMTLTLDGISGIKIYNVLRVDSSFLPQSYGNSLEFIVTAVNHTISDNEWKTELELTIMPKAGDKVSGAMEDFNFIFDDELIEKWATSRDNIIQQELGDETNTNADTAPGTKGSGTGNGKKTLGTGATKADDNFAKNAYGDETELNKAIKAGLDKLNTL